MSLALAAMRLPVQRADATRLDRVVVESCATGIEREVLWLELSQIPAGLNAPRHLRLATEALAPLGNADRAQLFALANSDIAVVWRGAAETLVAACAAALQRLFVDDAVLLPDPQTLLRRFSLPRDAATVRLLMVASQRRDAVTAEPAQPSGRHLTLAALTSLEANLASADVARFARRRAVCVLDDADGLVPAWETRLLSVLEIADTLAPGFRLQSDVWLFRRLTRSLDRRMLALLASPDELRDAGPFGLHLNIGSVLAPEFLRFDAALPGRLRGHVVIGLDPADVLADPAAFQFARAFARARHYRLMLRNLSPASLALFSAPGLDLDLLQLRWSPAWAATSLPPARLNPASFVVSHTDSVAALQWGRNRGIRLYQGPIIAPVGRGIVPRSPG